MQGAVFLDREKTIEALHRIARRVRVENPAVSRIVLFGSLAEGSHSAFSDADLLVILKSGERRPMDRIPALLLAFADAPVGVDVLPVLEAELPDNAFARRAERAGIVLGA